MYKGEYYVIILNIRNVVYKKTSMHLSPYNSTPTLTDLKRMSYNARRDNQNSDQPPQERHERRQAYDTIRRLYTNAVKATKRESWRDFLTEQAQSGCGLSLP